MKSPHFVRGIIRRLRDPQDHGAPVSLSVKLSDADILTKISSTLNTDKLYKVEVWDDYEGSQSTPSISRWLSPKTVFPSLQWLTLTLTPIPSEMKWPQLPELRYLKIETRLRWLPKAFARLIIQTSETLEEVEIYRRLECDSIYSSTSSYNHDVQKYTFWEDLHSALHPVENTLKRFTICYPTRNDAAFKLEYPHWKGTNDIRCMKSLEQVTITSSLINQKFLKTLPCQLETLVILVEFFGKRLLSQQDLLRHLPSSVKEVVLKVQNSHSMMGGWLYLARQSADVPKFFAVPWDMNWHATALWLSRNVSDMLAKKDMSWRIECGVHSWPVPNGLENIMPRPPRNLPKGWIHPDIRHLLRRKRSPNNVSQSSKDSQSKSSIGDEIKHTE
ncbi:hypothetical protein M422DRAFT_35597 [Sphaerobolus stellatus SS14]|uniref:Uncharacterized protein n=1 Tax=Sphaerobolus stellatus (strain SS14) TaxID=990650 RepID=A0A0C9UEJ2_SPHS4|nr:hypothetical protein M422DRAFT_35597 [Sphaerobolus stellatus SS14]